MNRNTFRCYVISKPMNTLCEENLVAALVLKRKRLREKKKVELRQIPSEDGAGNHKWTTTMPSQW
jgi:hypothetical protein